MKYCLNCKQLVDPQKKFNWGIFLCTVCCCGLGFIYLIGFVLLGIKKCPMCNSTNWGVQHIIQPKIVPQNQNGVRFCPNCGANINLDDAYCTQCGRMSDRSK